MQLTPEHTALRDTLNRFIDTEVNPHVDEWERDEIFPAHQVFGRLGGYTRDRQAFGRSVLDNQWVHYRLAELQTEVACLRAICWQGVAEVTAGQDATRTATMAKLKAGRVIREVADSCLQFWGGMGFMDESPISRIFRDGRLTSIGGGADEVMLQILSKFMGIFPQPA